MPARSPSPMPWMPWTAETGASAPPGAIAGRRRRSAARCPAGMLAETHPEEFPMTSAPTGMTRAQLEQFLAESRNIMVAAIRPDGRPQVTPNWFHWDGERFYISTTKTRQKYKNFRRDPRVQLVLDEPTGFRTVLIDGTTEIWEDHERGLPYFSRITEKHTGRTP